jgi:hypothetical protein
MPFISLQDARGGTQATPAVDVKSLQKNQATCFGWRSFLQCAGVGMGLEAVRDLGLQRRPSSTDAIVFQKRRQYRSTHK